MFWIELIFLFLTLCDFHGTYSADPCTGYTAINDTKWSIAYKATGMDSLACQTLPVLKWYRYAGTDNGRMASTCPQDQQCGSKNQIWFNERLRFLLKFGIEAYNCAASYDASLACIDTIPAEADGETMKQICIHEGPLCCPKSNKINTKNCTDFIVYQYIPGQPKCTNYYYEAPEKSLSTKEGVKSSSETSTSSLTSKVGALSSDNKISLITTEGGKSGLDKTTTLITTEGRKSRSNNNAPFMWMWIFIPISVLL